MCLSQVNQTKNLPEKIIGYKCGQLNEICFITGDMESVIPLNTTLVDSKEKILLGWDYNRPSCFYEAGFHVFESLRDAQDYSQWDESIVKVELSKISVKGIQDGATVYVGKAIKILEEVK